MKTLRHWIRSLAPLGVALTLVGCSASQQTSPPTPPKPPSEPSTPSPTPPTDTTDAGATPEAEPPEPSTPSANTPEAPEPAETDSSGDEGEADSAEAGAEAGDETESGNEAAVETTEGGEAAATSSGGSPGAPAGGIPAGTTRTTDERRAGLDGQLDASLREFDGLILKEQGILDGRREETAEMTGGGGGGVGEGLGEAEGSGAGASGSGEDAEADSQEGPTQVAGGTGGSPDAPPENSSPSSPGATIDGDPKATDLEGRIPGDVGDGGDDDIVARQLREAAMQEEDPALRERLWDEYRAYKKGTK